MFRLSLAALAALLFPLHAVGLRVVTLNVGAHFTDGGYPDYGLGDPGTVDYDSVLAVLQRIDADVIALQEIHSADLSGSPDDVDALAAALGCPYVYGASTSGSFDTSLRVVFLSKHPFIATSSINSPPGAKEITRLFPTVTVDVPGTDRDPVLVSAHLKAGTLSADKFRKAIEMRRLAGWLAGSGLQGSDNFILLGDFNPSGSNSTYNSLPSGLPGTYDLGDDVSFPVSYSTNMVSYFNGPIPTRLDPRQLNGSDGTFQSGSTLDLLMVSPGLAGRPYGTEIYNSALDVSNGDGLPKSGLPLASPTSLDASDHYAVFADFELDPNLSNLGLAVSGPSVAEGDPEGTVSLTVSLPAPAAAPVTVSLSSDESAAEPVELSLEIPMGGTGAVTAVRTSRNFLFDGTRTVTFTAGASGYGPAQATVQLLDSDAGYAFSQPGEVLAEDFDAFDGMHDPAPWVSDASGWVGEDDGSSAAIGGRAYGSDSEKAAGFVTDGTAVVMETSYLNGSAVPLTIVDLAYDAEQWRPAFGGAEDSIVVELILGGVPVSIPELGFVAATDLPDGPLAGGNPQSKSVRVEGLSVAPGESFGLRFRFVPGSGSAPPSSDVWINEFHYDNSGTDTGEFLEVVVGPGFAGEDSDIEIVRYNGSNPAAAVTYNTALILGSASFTLAGTYDGYRFYVADLPTDGIQNGGNDGFAVVDAGHSTVLHLISYEGVFAASNGPAAGLTSVDIGVSQSGTTPAGQSLGLAGSGGGSPDFSWVSFASSSKGAPNAGQTLEAPGLSPQGLGVDNVAVTFVSDNDLDGLADDQDPDDDNDGSTDEFEMAFGTDPFDAGSIFVLGYDGSALHFPGAEGVVYTIEWGPNLTSWENSATVVGEGAEIVFSLPVGESRVFARVRAGE